MKDIIRNALSGESSISSRRLILLFTMLIGAIVDISIIALSFKICLSVAVNTINTIQVLDVLIKLTITFKVFILLLSGIITWQNITDSIHAVKGTMASTTTLEMSKSEIITTQ